VVPPTQWTDNDWTAIGTVLGAIGAVAVAVLAIWGDTVRNLIFTPKLDLKIAMKEPDCVKIQTVALSIVGGGQNAPLIQQALTDSYYMRLRVNNTGSVAARGVEVRLTALRAKQPNGTFQDDPSWLPLSLVWSNTRDPRTGAGKVVLEKIDKDVPRHCDLCHVVHGAAPLLMEFDTEVAPNQIAGAWPTKRAAGTCEVDVVATADNAGTVRHVVEVFYSGQWHANPTTMFATGIRVTVKT
jgi:hypothetical protein